jgi:hypothetical protein
MPKDSSHGHRLEFDVFVSQHGVPTHFLDVVRIGLERQYPRSGSCSAELERVSTVEGSDVAYHVVRAGAEQEEKQSFRVGEQWTWHGVWLGVR